MKAMRNATGTVIESWDRFDPFHIHGVMPANVMNGRAGTDAPLAVTAGPGLAERNTDKPWHPDSPMFWVGILLATTFGMIAASTSIRVGPFKAAVAAGKQ
jgi:hypothetical protein